MSPGRAPPRSGLAWVLLAACVFASLPAADGSAPAFIASRGVTFPNVPTKFVGPSYAVLRVQLDSPGVVYYLATPQDDGGVVTDVSDDGTHVVETNVTNNVTNVTTTERRAAPLPEEVREGALAFFNATDADFSNDANDTYAFGYAALVAGAIDVPAANTIYTVNVTNLNPQSMNDLWVVAASSSDALQQHTTLLPFYTKKLPPEFLDVIGLDQTLVQTPYITVSGNSVNVVALLQEPGTVYLAVQSSSTQALTSEQVKTKALANETHTCYTSFPAANVYYQVPVGCPVFGLNEATSLAAYYAVEGFGREFNTSGKAPISETPFVWRFITADTVVPRGEVSVSGITSDGFTINVQSTKNGIARFVVLQAVNASSPHPSFENMLDGVGVGGIAPIKSGFINLYGDPASGSISITGLVVGKFDVFVVLTDNGAWYLTALASLNSSDVDFNTSLVVQSAPRNVNATVLSVLGVETT